MERFRWYQSKTTLFHCRMMGRADHLHNIANKMLTIITIILPRIAHSKVCFGLLAVGIWFYTKKSQRRISIRPFSSTFFPSRLLPFPQPSSVMVWVSCEAPVFLASPPLGGVPFFSDQWHLWAIRLWRYKTNACNHSSPDRQPTHVSEGFAVTECCHVFLELILSSLLTVKPSDILQSGSYFLIDLDRWITRSLSGHTHLPALHAQHIVDALNISFMSPRPSSSSMLCLCL